MNVRLLVEIQLTATAVPGHHLRRVPRNGKKVHVHVLNSVRTVHFVQNGNASKTSTINVEMGKAVTIVIRTDVSTVTIVTDTTRTDITVHFFSLFSFFPTRKPNTCIVAL